jgi:putative ABC transport system permease protein
MYLATRELRRARSRFALLVVTVALLVFLILTQQTLQAGLIDSFVSGIRTQSAPVLALTVDGRRNLQASIITPELAERITATPGIARTGRLGVRSVNVSGDAVPAPADGDTATGISAALVGYDQDRPGALTGVADGRFPTATGEILADSAAGAGFGVGDRVRVEPGGYELVVVGVADDAQLLASPTLYLPWDTYAEAVAASSPDARAPLPSAIALEPAPGTEPEALAAALSAAVADVEALTRDELAADSPGVAEITQSFQVIFALYALVVPLVTGLFFLIITFQKAGSLTLLRAVGISGGRLVRSLLIQVTLVVGTGVAIGTALYLPLTTQRVGSIALSPQTGAIVFWAILLVVLALAASAVSARRVLRIAPVTATTGAGERGGG